MNKCDARRCCGCDDDATACMEKHVTYAATNVPSKERPMVVSSDGGGCSAAGSGLASLSLLLELEAMVSEFWSQLTPWFDHTGNGAT